ncbi:MAG TPA: M23 family metallopeptidase, partial [Candidatus Babeliales bacterium]|nr:M23 family metallopeptidase [Candidatus Babeliales bacterium]
IMMILMILLFVEYRFFCKQAQDIIELKQQYTQYVDVLNRKINGDEINALQDILYPQSSLRYNWGPHQEETKMEQANERRISDENELDIVDDIDAPSFCGVPDWNEMEIGVQEVSDAPDNDDDYDDDSFVVINRQPEYLKQSTLDYIQAEDLNSLMTAIDVDRWSDYTEVRTLPTKKPDIQKKRITKPVSQSKTHIIAHRPLKDYGFIWPIDADKFWLSSLFGPRKRIDGTWGFHHGIDMAAVKGTIVKAVQAGTVVEACFQAGYGNTVVIQHSDVLKTRYAHLHTIRAYVGQKIKQGAIVGTVGETGFIRKKGKDGSHLHFELYEKGKRMNPMHCLPRVI